MKLTIWKIKYTKDDLDPPTFRWTLENDFVTIVSIHFYKTRKEATLYAIYFAKEHFNLNIFEHEIRYNGKTGGFVL
jgi:hypothetical protein